MNQPLSEQEIKRRKIHVDFNTKKSQVFLAFNVGDIDLPEAQARYQVVLNEFNQALDNLNVGSLSACHFYSSCHHATETNNSPVVLEETKPKVVIYSKVSTVTE